MSEPAATPSRFERDTAVRPAGGGAFEARLDRGWWISRGPNGGYVAATLLRALRGAVGDPARHARSLTVHYTLPPEEGPAHLETRVERTGRSLSTVSGRLVQGGRTRALALGAFSLPRTGPEFQEARPPAVPPPADCPEVRDGRSPIRERYECRAALAPAPDPTLGPARTGGWIRLREPQPLDAAAVAALADSWPPALMQRTWPEGEAPSGFPTVDLTVHFRVALPRPGLAPDAFWLVQFATRVVRDGFLEEDGEVWAPDGTLVAHSRQLAVLL